MKEIPIGGEIRIRCVRGIGKCKECALFMIQDNPHCVNVCNPNLRTDHKNVHFELVENPEPITLPTDEWICAYSSMFYTGSAVHYVREGMRIMRKMIEEKLNQKDKDNEK